MLAYGDGDDEERYGLLHGVGVVEQFHDILALYGLDAYVSLLAHVDAFFYECLHHTARLAVSCSLAEGTPQYGTHAREGCIDEQFAPSCADEVVLHLYRAH